MKFKYTTAALACAFLVGVSAQAQNQQGSQDQDKAASKPANNTGKNVRDRSDSAVTPEDQHSSKEDREITRKIRRAIVKKDGLSTSAKNVKIVTKEGKVTLRGPVNSAEEQQQIAAVAKEVEGVSAVDNQLEVKEKK